MKTIPYYWKYSLQYLLCPRILRTTLVLCVISGRSLRHSKRLTLADMGLNKEKSELVFKAR